MKTDLASSIAAAIVGIIISYLICNLIVGEIQPVEITTVDASVTADLDDPSVEVFNYKALNPTVEVYVGDCSEYNSYGECIDNNTQGN